MEVFFFLIIPAPNLPTFPEGPREGGKPQLTLTFQPKHLVPRGLLSPCA